MIDLSPINSVENSFTLFRNLDDDSAEKRRSTNRTSTSESLSQFDSEIDTNYTSAEKLIEERAKKISQEFESQIRDSEFEFGKISNAERFAEELSSTNPIAFQLSVGMLFRENAADDDFLIGLFRCLASVNKSCMREAGYAIVVSGIFNKNPEVVQSALAVIDHWRDKSLMPLIKTLEFQQIWIKKYIERLINNFESV